MADPLRGRIPALDGLRALAVIAVVAFHGGISGASGGFLGVSLFFTLSGYLITTLLVNEFSTAGSISLRSFYIHRWRRLVPAAWVAVAGVLALTAWWSASQRSALAGDAFASLGNVANWRFAFADRSYQDLFIGKPSPLAHFWSLAIEEQFYLVIPLVAVVALRGGRRRLAVVLGLLFVASVIATVLTRDNDFVYNGSHTRAAEILAGSLLAMVPATVLASKRVTWLGWPALTATVLLVTLTDLGDEWLYRGGLVVVALVSTAAIASLVGSRGSSLARVLSVRPLVAIGALSYSLYLVHWPIFLVLDEERTSLRGAWLFVLRVAVSFAVAEMVTRLVERPVRERRALVARGHGLFASALAGSALVVAIVVMPGPNFTENEVLLAAGESGVITFDDPPLETVPIVVSDRRPLLVLGSDPTVSAQLDEHGIEVLDRTDSACPITPSVEVQLRDGTTISTTQCPDPVKAWARILASADAEGVAGVVIAFGDVDDGIVRRVDDDGYPGPLDLTGLDSRWAAVDAAVRAARQIIPTWLPVLMVRLTPGETDLQKIVARYVLEEPTIERLDRSIDELLAGIDRVGSGIDNRIRTLVIGDSTSVIAATALHQAAGDVLDVMWVGVNGCPVVPVEALRSSTGEDWQVASCPSYVDLVAPALDQFRPDVVVLIAVAGEVREQRYEGDPVGHVAGDPEFTRVHDDFMARFIAPLVERGIPLLVADSPPLRASAFVSEQIADPQRLGAWNAQIRRWIAGSSDIGLFPLADVINAKEELDGRPIRVDGIHPDLGLLASIIRPVLLDAIISAVPSRQP